MHNELVADEIFRSSGSRIRILPNSNERLRTYMSLTENVREEEGSL